MSDETFYSEAINSELFTNRSSLMANYGRWREDNRRQVRLPARPPIPSSEGRRPLPRSLPGTSVLLRAVDDVASERQRVRVAGAAPGWESRVRSAPRLCLSNATPLRSSEAVHTFGAGCCLFKGRIRAKTSAGSGDDGPGFPCKL